MFSNLNNCPTIVSRQFFCVELEINCSCKESSKRTEKRFYLTKNPFQMNETGFPINEPLVN